MQWLGTNRHPVQRSPLMPPRARKGLVLRASRAVRKRATAWGGSETRGTGTEGTGMPDELAAKWSRLDVFWVNRLRHPFEGIGESSDYEGRSLSKVLVLPLTEN
jgi:hypothetical protein